MALPPRQLNFYLVSKDSYPPACEQIQEDNLNDLSTHDVRHLALVCIDEGN